jgi:MOSC domain-containing protein YiiM
MSKPERSSITLIEGLGVEGDVHNGTTVKHRGRMRKDPTQPNLRQVHLIHAELFEELREDGFDVRPGFMGENITTSGIDLLSQPTGTRLHIGEKAVVEITGLRNPCTQLDGLMPGLMKAVLGRDENGELIRKAGVMTIVVSGGEISPNDSIVVELPTGEHIPLQPV